MFRSVNYSSRDVYCRYLDTSLCHNYSSGLAGGRFGYYLKENFAVEKLPYDVKILQLIVANAFPPDLFVQLPVSFFKKWSNFPECPASWKGEVNEEEEAAGKYNIYCHHPENLDLNDLLHPYDLDPLCENFVQRFKSEIPKRLPPVRSGSNRSFLPFEAYYSYWRCYALAEALTGYLDIETFLPRRRGVPCLIERIAFIDAKFNEKYGDAFRRLSMYRTAASIIHSRHSKTNLTYQEIGQFFLKKNSATIETLEIDLERLLVLYCRWYDQIERNGRRNLEKPLELLRQDVYHLFEWLCTNTDKGEMYYFDKWSYNNRCANSWVQLQDVISYEAFELKKTFLRSIKFYCNEIQAFGYASNLDEVYERLCEIGSFSPWMRSFADLHKSINRKGIIDFKQPRILDYLIIMTTRTEIVIRSLFTKYCRKEAPSEMSKLFSELAIAVRNKSGAKTLGCLHNDWHKTKLNDKPDEIFKKIEAIPDKNGWSRESMHFYKEILRFVTSRNYFAHHSYKDKIINSRNGTVTAAVLKSCVQSLVYLDAILQCE